MIKARVRVSTDKWWDVEVPDDALNANEARKAQIAVQAWWIVTANYHGAWAPQNGEPSRCSWDNNVFTCYVDDRWFGLITSRRTLVMLQRQFTIRYGNWNPITAKVPGEKIAGKTGIDIVRAAVGHAFMEQLKGDWQDGPDIKVLLDKDNTGVWVGRRQHPQTGKKEEPFYVMEI